MHLRTLYRTRVTWALATTAMLALASVFTGCGAAPMPSQQMTTPQAGNFAQAVLLFSGTGTSPSDVSAVEAILKGLGLAFTTVNSTQLDAMTQAQLASYKLLIIPGGNSITIGTNLSTAATANIRNAVTQDGLHYLGICAGAFFGGSSIYNGVDLTSGVFFNFFADENKGIHKEPLTIAFPNNTALQMYWEDGPQLSGWGSVVGEFPDGTPAITEGNSGKGFVMLTGIHAEAPASWRTGMNFTTPVSADLSYAGTLIQAAFSGKPLPHF